MVLTRQHAIEKIQHHLNAADGLMAKFNIEVSVTNGIVHIWANHDCLNYVPTVGKWYGEKGP